MHDAPPAAAKTGSRRGRRSARRAEQRRPPRTAAISSSSRRACRCRQPGPVRSRAYPRPELAVAQRAADEVVARGRSAAGAPARRRARSRLTARRQSLISQITAPDGDDGADLGRQAGDRAGLVGGERLLHLHRLEHDDRGRPPRRCRRRLTATLTMVPCIGAVSASPDAAAPALRAAERFGAALRAAAGRRRRRRRSRPAATPRAACRRPRRRRVSRAAGLGRSASAAAGERRDLVVELGLDPAGVDGERLVVVGANAGSRTTARWNGSAVAMPSTTNSSSARRERSSASSRVAPVTISLASSESNAPPMTDAGLDAGVDAHARAGRLDDTS